MLFLNLPLQILTKVQPEDDHEHHYLDRQAVLQAFEQGSDSVEDETASAKPDLDRNLEARRPTHNTAVLMIVKPLAAISSL